MNAVTLWCVAGAGFLFGAAVMFLIHYFETSDGAEFEDD